jgi:putative selenate reductase molybdopterin-binding subunit
MKNVNKAFRKKDAMQLVTGKPVYMDDLAPADCLIVKLYRSPHANAMVERIDTSVAKKVPGIEAIFTWEDVDQNARRYTQAGQTYPEASWSLTATSALWGTWWPLWWARMRSVSRKP